jgi:class 3 adenylate cyclase
MDPGAYPAFFRRAVRNLIVGTLLSVLPAGAFYFSTYDYTEHQFLVLCVLGLLDLAIFLPLDIAILRWRLAPAKAALVPEASAEQVRAGMVRLLDSPREVLLRVYGPHALAASTGITLLVWAANRWLELGVSTTAFPLYWALNLSVIPIAHVVYEFAAMERATQPLLRELAQRTKYDAALGHRFTLEGRMGVFFPLLAFAPIAVMLAAIFIRHGFHEQVDSGELLRNLALLGAASAALFLFLMYVLGGQLKSQTTELIQALDRLGRGDLAARAELYTTSEFGQIAAHINDTAVALGERQKLRDLFGAYMSSEVAEALLAKGEAGDLTEKRYVAILFVDVRGFTAFSQHRTPEVVVGVLNQFFEAAVDAIAASGGTVNKYLGDGLLAIFGAPVALEQPGRAAVEAAIEMSQRLRALSQRLESTGVPALKIGIGIHAGEVVVGSIGSPRHKLEYTVIGDPVNVASRIEQLNKSLGTEILISEEVFRTLPDPWRGRAGEPVSELVKGIDQPVKVYPLSPA